MFNPSDIKLSIGCNFPQMRSFVGIRQIDNELVFCLPWGFQDFPLNDDVRVNKLFFSLYRILKKFAFNRLSNSKTSSDGFNTDGRFSVIDSEEDTYQIYSSISTIEKFFETYDNMQILHILQSEKDTEDIKYNQFHKYIHKCIFLDDNTPFIDSIILPGNQIELSLIDLVKMYCYILSELNNMLHFIHIDDLISSQAEVFQGNYLSADSKLFSKSHNETIENLKRVLYQISKQTSWKNSDYWFYYNIIHDFLYGSHLSDNGNTVYWGISNFSHVWEEMCAFWCESTFDDVIYIDNSTLANTTIGNNRVFIKEDFEPPFKISINNHVRNIRPDIVRCISPDRDTIFNDYFKFSKNDKKTIILLQRKYRNQNGSKAFEDLIRDIKPGFRNSKDKYEYTTFALQSKIDESINRIKFKMSSPQKKYFIVDCKYVPISVYQTETDKCSSDIQKQNAYECCMQLYAGNSSVISQFCIPKYNNNPINNIATDIDRDILGKSIQNTDISVTEIDFTTISESYII